MPPFDHLNTDFLGALQRVGVDPAAVDVVVNTHIHSDHVGWNTMRQDIAWVPTFPNARYLMPEPDYRYFHPENADQRPPPPTEADAARRAGALVVFEDSILPVEAQIELWAEDYQISESLRLRPAQGHTPGSSVLWLDAGKPAVFVGDLTQASADRGVTAARGGDPRALSRTWRYDGGRPWGRVHGRRLAGAAASVRGVQRGLRRRRGRRVALQDVVMAVQPALAGLLHAHQNR